MADEDDDEKEGPRSPESQDESGSSSEADSDSEPEVIPLAAGREKRATAGNRMNSLLAAAEEDDEDDEVALLFAAEEEDEDVEFEGDDDDAGSDGQLDSSSDDDDQGPNAATEDDLEGELQLQKKEKAERAKKRKANDVLTTTAGVRKKARFDSSISTKRPTAPAPAPKPSKKKERESWLWRETEGPSRTSLRPQTVANTEVIRAKVKHDDEQHAKVVEKLKKKRLEREKDMPPEMTQADRLAEAEKVEKKNAKSLNRWEAMEKKRAEEQAARLAALHDRKLEGPVVTWWSGGAKWLGPKLTMVGSKETHQEPVAEGKKRGRKPKSYYEALEAGKEADAENSPMATPRDQTSTPAPSEAAVTSGTTTEAPTVLPELAPSAPVLVAAASRPDSHLHGEHAAASLGPEAVMAATPGATTNLPAEPAPATAAANDPSLPLALPAVITHPTPFPPDPTISSGPLPPPQQPPPPVPETSTRNLVILTSFDTLPPHSKQLGEYSFFSNSRKTPKPVKHTPELCAITSLPARYRDPATGLGYANAHAYQKLQEMQKQSYVWSALLGCYVGRSGVAARGVPDGFLGA